MPEIYEPYPEPTYDPVIWAQLASQRRTCEALELVGTPNEPNPLYDLWVEAQRRKPTGDDA